MAIPWMRLDVLEEESPPSSPPWMNLEVSEEETPTVPWMQIPPEIQPMTRMEAWDRGRREVMGPDAFLWDASPLFAKVFDYMLRGQYASASAMEAFFEGMGSERGPFQDAGDYQGILPALQSAWEAGIEGLKGERRRSYIDLVRRQYPDMPPWLQSAIGFAGDVFLDPATYIGIGAIPKVGKGGRSLVTFAGRGLDSLPGALGRAGAKINEKTFSTLQSAVDAVKNSKFGSWYLRHFSSRGKIKDDKLWEAYQAARSEAEYLANEAIKNNVPLRQAVEDIEKNLGVPKDVLMDMIERPIIWTEREVTQLGLPFAETAVSKEVAQRNLPSLTPVKPPETIIRPKHLVEEGDTLSHLAQRYNTTVDRLKEINNLKSNRIRVGQELEIPWMEPVYRTETLPPQARSLVEQFQDIQKGRVEREIAEGIGIQALDSDLIEYMGHYLTPEARKALERSPEGVRKRFQYLLNQNVQHPSVRGRKLRDLSVSQINELARQGEILPNFTGEFFISDPVMVNAIRDAMSGRSIAAARFIREVSENPEWAIPLKEMRAGYRPLSQGAQHRFGPLVKDRAFRDDIADALDTYVQRAFDPRVTDEFIQVYDQWLNVWKQYTLGTRPQWMVNNLMGNLWNGYVLAGASPASLAEGFRILTKGRAQQVRHSVQAGETLSQIAKNYGVPMERIVSANNIRDANKIFAGENLIIPKGDTLIKGMSDSEILTLAERFGAIRTGLYGGEIQQTIGETFRRSAGRIAAAPTRPIFAANQIIEDWTRLGLFVDGLHKGLDPKQAAMRVKRYLFDYTDLTPTEQAVMKRLAPFYTWTRKNIPLQLEHMVTDIGTYTSFPKGQQAFTAAQEEVYPGVAMPPWMQRSALLRVGSDPGTARFMSMRGLPTADVIEILGDVMQGQTPGYLMSMNPLISAGYALGGLDTFSRREIPENALTSIFPGYAMDSRRATALANLFPPVQTLARLAVPYQDPLLPDDPNKEIREFALGYRTYQRDIARDIESAIQHHEREIQRINHYLRSSVIQGREWEIKAYEDRRDQLVDELVRMIEILGDGPGGK